MGKISEETKRKKEYKHALAVTREAIRRRPKTVSQLAKLLGCTKPTVYNHLAKLRKTGLKVEKKKVRLFTTGPKAIAFQVAR